MPKISAPNRGPARRTSYVLTAVIVVPFACRADAAQSHRPHDSQGTRPTPCGRRDSHGETSRIVVTCPVSTVDFPLPRARVQNMVGTATPWRAHECEPMLSLWRPHNTRPSGTCPD
jgi:hypothetical protein